MVRLRLAQSTEYTYDGDHTLTVVLSSAMRRVPKEQPLYCMHRGWYTNLGEPRPILLDLDLFLHHLVPYVRVVKFSPAYLESLETE